MRWATTLRLLFFAFVVRPVMYVAIGLNVRHRHRLPRHGPAIVVANHNSHMDTMALMSLFPLRLLPKIRPVAAEDYFMSSKAFGWFAANIIGIVPIDRDAVTRGRDPFKACHDALADDAVLLVFPEGTRGRPERLSSFKKGIGYLADRHPTVPIIPVFLHGFGKVLPKGDWVPVPFFCDIFVGDPVARAGSHEAFTAALEARIHRLAIEEPRPTWE